MRARLLFTLAVSCALGLQGCGASETDAPPTQAADPSQPAAAPAPPRKSLPDATEVAAQSELGPDLVKVDLAAALAGGTLKVEANDPLVTPALTSLFDGDTASLLRSAGINPVIITLTLTEPVQLRAARVYSTYSRFDWVIEATPGGPRLLVRDAPDGAWSTIQLDQAQDTTVVRIEVLRLERDDFVHFNEIELYTS